MQCITSVLLVGGAAGVCGPYRVNPIQNNSENLLATAAFFKVRSKG
jgi:hypothetical protein